MFVFYSVCACGLVCVCVSVYVLLCVSMCVGVCLCECVLVCVLLCVLGCAWVCVLVWCVRVRSRAQDIFHGQKTQPTHEGSVVTEWHLCQYHYIYGHKTRCYQTRVATRPRLWQRDMLVVYPFDHIVRDWHATESLKSGWEFKQGKVGIVDKSANPSR